MGDSAIEKIEVNLTHLKKKLLFFFNSSGSYVRAPIITSCDSANVKIMTKQNIFLNGDPGVFFSATTWLEVQDDFSKSKDWPTHHSKTVR